MKRLTWWRATMVRLLLCALPLACLVSLMFAGSVSAHAILLRSDPARDATLALPPSQVRMWFSEDLNPTFSTAYVVNAANSAASVQSDSKTHVDNGDVHVSSSDSKEMDLTLKSNLPPAVYLVLYRTQSAEDGHVLRGYYLFKVADANGVAPTFTGQISLQNSLGGSSNGQLDAQTLFSVIMVTLVELGAVFWMGAQFWLTFVFQSGEEVAEWKQEIARAIERRFDERFALPVLFLLFLANIGVLVGQALTVNGGDWAQAFSPQILYGLISRGQFATYWIMREVVILIAFALALYTKFSYTKLGRDGQQKAHETISLVNLVAGLALLIAITLSGHAAATSSNVVVYAVISDFLHLIAASLWVGGMFYIVLVYLPILRLRAAQEQTRSLLAILPRYSPLAIAGVIIMAASGPFNATTRMDSWNQLLGTSYGRTLIIKVVLVGALLLVSALHVLIMRPRLARIYKQYTQEMESASPEGEKQTASGEEDQTNLTPASVKQLEEHVISQTRRLQTTLRWEPLLGVAVLFCTALLTAFSSTLLPATATQPATIQSTQAKTYSNSVTTTDNAYKIKLSIDPNHFGLNTFSATVYDSKGVQMSGTQVGVSLYTTMLDMDMGTDSVNLQPDNKGHFSARGELGMGGNWQIRIEIRTPDSTLHGATFKMYTPF